MRRDPSSACHGRNRHLIAIGDSPPAPMGSPESARRLFAMAQPISRTIAEAYLRNRGITALHDAPALRFHPPAAITGPTPTRQMDDRARLSASSAGHGPLAHLPNARPPH